MKQTKTLRELIELAKAGKIFMAKNFFNSPFRDRDFLSINKWSERQVLADWTYEEIKEPIKLEFESTVQEFKGLYSNDGDIITLLSKWPIAEEIEGKKFKVTMVEVVE